MVVVTRKYQVTIPKEVRKGLGIKAGDEIVFVKTKEGYVIKRLEDFVGRWQILQRILTRL